MEAIIFVGIQAAGKSIFYRDHFFHTHVRINLDMLKTRHRERILVQACVVAKQRFVVDNTNVLVKERAAYIGAARRGGFAVIGYYFQSNVAEAIRRNSQRSGNQFIPAKGIAGTAKRLEMPHFEEGFDRLYHVSINAANQFVVRDWAEAGNGNR